MDNIVLDTNIFIRENFLHGKKIKSLLHLSEKGKIDLYITEITYNELKANFEKFLNNSIVNHNRFRKDSDNWILQNELELQSVFSKIDSSKVLINFNSKLDELIDKSIIKIIPYKAIDIKLVFDKYFKPESPFGKADKKSEFPDAFTLELIDDFFVTKGIKGIVFSTDKDFLSSKFPNFDIRNDYQEYLEKKYTEMELVKKRVTEEIFLTKTVELEKHLIEWYKDHLDDTSLFYDAVNWKEVYDIEVDSIIVENMNYKIIEIVNDIVILEITADVKVKVNILTDDEEYMYYDSDDKSYHYLETNYESFEKSFESSMIVNTEIIDEDDYLEDFEIESVNDGKDITFNLENDY